MRRNEHCLSGRIAAGLCRCLRRPSLDNIHLGVEQRALRLVVGVGDNGPEPRPQHRRTKHLYTRALGVGRTCSARQDSTDRVHVSEYAVRPYCPRRRPGPFWAEFHPQSLAACARGRWQRRSAAACYLLCWAQPLQHPLDSGLQRSAQTPSPCWMHTGNIMHASTHTMYVQYNGLSGRASMHIGIIGMPSYFLSYLRPVYGNLHGAATRLNICSRHLQSRLSKDTRCSTRKAGRLPPFLPSLAVSSQAHQGARGRTSAIMRHPRARAREF